MALPVHEQETNIIFMRNSDMAVIYTSDSTTMTKLDKKVKSVNSEIDKPFKSAGDFISIKFICVPFIRCHITIQPLEFVLYY